MFRPGEAYQFDWSHEDVESKRSVFTLGRASSSRG